MNWRAWGATPRQGKRDSQGAQTEDDPDHSKRRPRRCVAGGRCQDARQVLACDGQVDDADPHEYCPDEPGCAGEDARMFSHDNSLVSNLLL